MFYEKEHAIHLKVVSSTVEHCKHRVFSVTYYKVVTWEMFVEKTFVNIVG